jgi:hypothetical protein
MRRGVHENGVNSSQGEPKGKQTNLYDVSAVRKSFLY